MRYAFVPDSDHEPSLSQVGGKAHGLYRLQQAGADVPPWFVITIAACSASMQAQRGSDATGETGLEALSPTLEVLAEIDVAVQRLGLGDGLLAVRSSARAEDSGGQSFAGQFASVLCVQPEDLPAAITRVWASATSPHCQEYARRHSVPLPDLIPAVVVQRMIAPDVSGVMFTADPVTGSGEVSVIAALYGLGEGIVSGACNADTYTVDRTGTVVKREIALKTQCVKHDPRRGHVKLVDVPVSQRETQVCSDAVLGRLASLGDEIAAMLGGPQDIEWCLTADHIHLLQARPIASLQQPPEAFHDEPLRIWDNANIVESYPGVILPLTFSFIDPMYSGVYRQVFRALGLGRRYLERQGTSFRMLGYYRGRAYYNLLNWYRLLSLLPGGARHRRHFDEMLGTGVGIKPGDLPRPPSPGPVRSACMVARLVARFLLLPLHVRKCMAHVRRVRAQADAVDLDTLQLAELVDHYERLERLFLRHWATPQVNDFYCQTATGLLKSAISRWLGEATVAHMHELLPVKESVESELAVVSLRELAATIRERPHALEACRSTQHAELLPLLRNDPVIGPCFDDHVRRFGDRWQGELKLETVTPRERPEVLLEVLVSHVLAPPTEGANGSGSAIGRAIDELPFAKRWVIGRLAWISRRLIANRENTRFERTRVFGLVRRVFRVIGRQLAVRGHLAGADDVFYLTKDEIFGFIEGSSVDSQLLTTVRARRSTVDSWRLQSVPGRLQGRGPLAEMQQADRLGDRPATPGQTLSGIGASAGIVRGRVKVIHSPADLGQARGCVVAAETTDPGWSFIFPLISGILVERGSMLSHAAIVAREMKIPAIVGIDGLMRRLRDQSLIEVDGAAGEVTVLEEGPEAPDES